MRGSEAARSVANFLLFDDNPLMRRNKYFYNKQYKKEELFVPDQVMIEILRNIKFFPSSGRSLERGEWRRIGER